VSENQAAAPFTLTKQTAKISHLNLREEKHGEESVPAVDVKITADVPNDFLSYLHPQLKWSLYDKPENPELVEDPGHFPRLRYSSLAPLHWDCGIRPIHLTIHGAVKKDNLDLVGKIGGKGLRLTCKDGGTVVIEFTVGVSNVPPALVGALSGLLGASTVKVSVAAAGDADPDED